VRKASSPESNLNAQMTSFMGFNTVKSYTDITIPEEYAASIFRVAE
jgi:hypothetical protein